MIGRETLTKALFEAISAAEAVYKNPEWAEWARTCETSVRLERGAALEASAIACAEADQETGRAHFAALAAFHATTSVAWAAGGEEVAARHSCRAAKRNGERAKDVACG